MASRILFVTGKGGSGKSRVARALALEAAARDGRALLIRMPGEGPARTAAENRPASREGAGLTEKLLDPARDLEAFLSRLLGFGLLARRLCDSRTFTAVAAAAPGLGDLVALGAILTAASAERGVTVVDAPATGHSVPLLASAARVLELAPIGPVAREARRAQAVLADPRAFTAILVATPEELALTEVVSLRADVAAAGVASSRVVVNALWPALVSAEDGELLAASGASPDAAEHWRRHLHQQEVLACFAKDLGSFATIAFRFDAGGLAREDVARLLASLGGAAA